jgi:type II secretory pathway component GspD/PulD (secretin)
MRLVGWLIVVATGGVVVCSAGRSWDQERLDIPVVRLEDGGRGQAAPGPPLPITRLDDRDRAADLDMPRAVSLTFSEPLAVRDVLLMLFRGTPLSIVFDPAANGIFIGELSNLSLRQSLEAVLFPTGLDYAVKGGVVRVFPRRAETRLFDVSYLDIRRAWLRRTKSLTGVDPAAPAAELTSMAESDFFGQLDAGVRALLSESGRAHVDRHAGLVQVTDFADRLDRVGIYIEAVTLRATRQVRLAARVIEVTLTDTAPIDWGLVAPRAGLGTGPVGAGIKVGDFNALLRAIGTFGALRVIAAPQVVAMNNEPTVMRIGSQRVAFEPSPLLPATRASVNRDSRNVSPAADTVPSLPIVNLTDGMTLTITPQISSDGIVLMSVSPSFTERQPGAAATEIGSVVEADVMLRVRSGDTAVISGLLRGVSRTAAPSHTADALPSPATSELVILLTPTVVNAGASPVAGAQ